MLLLKPVIEPTTFETREQCDALAERIAAVLRERKMIGDERRRQEREAYRRNSDRALARYYKLRGDVRDCAVRPTKEIDRVYDTIMSTNAAAVLIRPEAPGSEQRRLDGLE